MKCSYSSDGFDMETAKSAHAVLIHARHMDTKRPQYKGLPPYRDNTQKWIFYESEVAPNTWDSVDKNYDIWKVFNLTATLTSDSDIPLHPIMKCKPKANFEPSKNNYAAKKSKMAAWFVSHCVTSSKREIFVEELKKFIDVDIYGDCGNTSICNRHEMIGHEQRKCMFALVKRDYWFYLGFENSLCDQYMTEKFFNTIRFSDVIPVVLGAGDYANVLPKDSYIDVRDFGSVKDLANFLVNLTKEPERYNAYIEKSRAYDCKFFDLKFECNLCEYLHQHRNETQIVLDAQSFWSMEERCVSPKDFYRKCAPEIIPKIQFAKYPDLFI
ncbi:hypothetical protein CAPTEDRAFT_145592 [Capitella teleta]|uniref:Fucosyltransferase n=1 Tax=Capitella teleta TaxID=283909 RepID=R7UHH2_CAPTE|nr:hypothetical protein CAPTEDRAFT_145592 [Capitella teleta]|eukprot:ELU05645.1 hypothetical protein CAPTEDRAFT_145592 [Capitella teleta]